MGLQRYWTGTRLLCAEIAVGVIWRPRKWRPEAETAAAAVKEEEEEEDQIMKAEPDFKVTSYSKVTPNMENQNVFKKMKSNAVWIWHLTSHNNDKYKPFRWVII